MKQLSEMILACFISLLGVSLNAYLYLGCIKGYIVLGKGMRISMEGKVTG